MALIFQQSKQTLEYPQGDVQSRWANLGNFFSEIIIIIIISVVYLCQRDVKKSICYDIIMKFCLFQVSSIIHKFFVLLGKSV